MLNVIPNYCYAIEAVNFLIIFVLLKTIIYCARKAHNATQIDYNFYMTIFSISGFFLISNSMALYRFHMSYFILKIRVADSLYIATWADRFGMLLAYICIDLLSRHYLPNWFLKRK